MKKIFVLLIFSSLLFLCWTELLIAPAKRVTQYNEYMESADSLFEQGYYVDAKKKYEQAKELNPKDDSLTVNIISCDYKMGNMDEFLKSAESYVNSAPKNPHKEVYIMLLNYYKAQESYVKYYDYLDRTIKAFPDSIDLQAEKEKTKGLHTDKYISYESEIGFVDEYAIAKFENGYRLVNKKGDYLESSPIYYDEIFDYSLDDTDALILAVRKDNKTCYYDRDGYLRESPTKNYDYLGAFHDGYALVRDGVIYSYIDKEFQQIEYGYQDATAFCHGVACVKKDDRWALIDKDFNLLTDFVYEDVVMNPLRCCSKSERIMAKDKDGYKLLNLKGEVVASNYQDAKAFLEDDGYAAVKLNDKWGLVDKNGELVLECQYEDLNSSNSDYCAYRTGKLWGYVDYQGNIFIEPTFEQATAFNNDGYAVVRLDQMCKLIRFRSYETEDGWF